MQKSKYLSTEVTDTIVSNNLEELRIKLHKEPNSIILTDKDGRNLLILSIICEHEDLCNYLMENFEFDLNHRDKMGWSALHYAVQNKFVSIIEKLINSIVNIEVKDDYGNTPLWRATFESKGDGEIIKILLDHGANPNNKNDSEISPKELAENIANYNVKQFFE